MIHSKRLLSIIYIQGIQFVFYVRSFTLYFTVAVKGHILILYDKTETDS